MLSFRQATAESEAQWEAFWRDLYERGLEGKGLQLVVTDGCPGLHRALDTVYPDISRQRCWVHKLRNVATKAPRKQQKSCLEQSRRIYASRTRRQAVAQLREWGCRWLPKRSLAWRGTWTSYYPSSPARSLIGRKVRTTNAIERAFREIRRRTNPMSCFRNQESVDRIIYGVVSHWNAYWKDKPLPEFTHNA